MTDRTPSAVRTGSRGDGAPVKEPAPGSAVPASATQSIPGAAASRPQGPGAPAGAAVSGNGSSIVGSLQGDGSGAAAPVAAGRAPRKGRSPREAGRGPRRARLQLRHVDTWSALKISLVLSIALFFIWMVAVGVLYGVLNALGVFETLNDLFGQVGSVSGNESTGDVITPGVVFGGAAIIGAINIVLLTALCTVGTFIYNLCSDLVGGLEITLSERD
jgi:hypothetical protein